MKWHEIKCILPWQFINDCVRYNTYEFICVMPLIHVSHVCNMTPFIRVTWHIHVWHDLFLWHVPSFCEPWLIHMRDMSHSYVWHDSSICVTWLIHMCDMTHSYVWHDSLICATWLNHMCDMTDWYVRHDSFTCVTWLIHMCDMAHS